MVGPNGCGKSNIVDAVRWVLGEQRTSVLRSEKMENVIFSGSNSAKQLGLAEVSLVIENTRNVLPTEFNEVLVTRRLYRSGDSEYLINKAPCRLKDINDLFVDTGMGPDSYSVIELKMVESILSTKTDERLRLFEEAAGINKYKQRRSAAFRKLESTEIDLSRVNDILSEVERNRNALKRQVNKAERYQQLSHEIEELEIRAASLELAAINKKLVPLKTQLSEQENTFQKNRSALSRDEADVERSRAMLLRMEEKLSELQNDLMSATDALHKNENEVITGQERIKANEEKIIRFEEERAGLINRIESLGRRIEETEPQVGILAEKADGFRIKHRKQQEELEEFEKILGRRRLELNESRMQLINLMNDISETEKHRHSLETKLLHLEGREEQLNAETGRLSRSDETLSRERNQWIEKENEFSNRRDTAINELKSQKNTLGALEGEIDRLKEESVQLNSRIAGLRQQEGFLHSLIGSSDGHPGGVGYVVQNRDKLQGILGTLGELISVPGKYRSAIEAILDEKAHYVIAQSESHALEAIDQLKQQKAGRVTFLILDRITKMKTFAEDVVDGENHGRVLCREVVKADQSIQPVIDYVLSGTYLVDDSESMKALAQKLMSSQAAWAIATLNGKVMTSRGELRSQRFESGEVFSPISRKEQLAELQVQIEKFVKDKSVNDKKILAQTHKREGFLADLAGLEEKWKKTEDAYQQSRIHSAQRQTAQSNLRSSLDSAQAELGKIRENIVEAGQQLDAIKPEIEEKLKQRHKQEEKIEALQDKLAGFESQRNELADEVHNLSVDLVKASSEHGNLQVDLDRMRRSKTEFENTAVAREREIEESKKDIAHYQSEVANKTELVADLRVRRDNLLEKQASQKQEHHHLHQSMNDKEAVLKTARVNGESSADILQNLRLEISENSIRIENLRGNIREKYSVDITPIEAATPEEISTIREDLEKKKERLRLMGPVNLLALDEFKKESERFEFMNSQKEDLVEAKNTLKETIEVINNTAGEKFERVFEQIRENFRENFSVFFEGGEGDLKISFEDEDPLSAKIVILARPSGKRLGAIELLSAGEKALTAIALLFSIYQVKPSPFCILDEVDAPLDDLNVKRFLRVLHRFSDNTQFILVTHNKLTMESADYIYGVTMEQEGISKIVSVELGTEAAVEGV